MICNLETTGIQSYIELHGQERSQKKDLRSHLGFELGTSCTEGHTLTNYAKKVLNSSPEEGLDLSLRQKKVKSILYLGNRDNLSRKPGNLPRIKKS